MIRIVSFTQLGTQLAGKIFLDWEPEEIDLRLKTGSSTKEEEISLKKWVMDAFAKKNALVFIGACQTAVYTIAPFIRDRMSDSPVLVVDELGQYVIPILSGDVGAANALAKRIAAKIGAIAVITTAVDMQKKFAVDAFAKKNHLAILNREAVAHVSGKILRGDQATISIQPDFSFEQEQESGNGMESKANYGLSRIVYGRVPEDLKLVPYPPAKQTDIVISTDSMALKMGVLRLKPKQYVIGIGCKRGTLKEEISAFVDTVILDWSPVDIAAIASIDRKADERGIIEWANQHQIPFVTFSENELLRVSGNFTASSFVERQVGVDNVCERAAMAAAGANAKLMMRKQVGEGITLAMAKRNWRIVFEQPENVQEEKRGNFLYGREQ